MRVTALAAVAIASLGGLTACGRVGFGDVAGDGGAPLGDGPLSTGPAGARWFSKVGNAVADAVSVDGTNGEVAITQRFSGTFNTTGVSLTGLGFVSSAVVRYDATGAVKQSLVLDAAGFCDMHSLIVDGDATLVVGLTAGTTAIPARGACSVVTNRQDPIALRIEADSTQSVIAHWVAGGANAQSWDAARHADGTLVMGGIYSDDLFVGAALPTAQADPNAWIARTQLGSTTSAAWSHGLVDAGEVHMGAIDITGDVTCVIGAYAADATLFGTSLTNVAGYDTWVARLAGDGSVDWVRGFGSPANEPNFENNASIVAMPDGTCVVGIRTTGDITIDSQSYPATDGSGVVLHFGPTGTVIEGTRVPETPWLARIDAQVYAAFTVALPYDIGGTTYTPDGVDTVVVELTGTTPSGLVVAVRGSGNQYARELSEVASDALAVTVATTGTASFDGRDYFSTTEDVVLGVFGL